MTNLQILHARGHSGIHNKGISKLNLVELDIGDNKKIFNVNHMKNLRELNIQGKCGVSYKGISKLDFRKVYVSDEGNSKI